MKKRIIFGGITVLAMALLLGLRLQSSSVHAEDARVVTVYVDGETRTIATNASTVQEVLDRLKTKLGDHDKTEPALDAPVQGAGFSVNVYRARPITVIDGANTYNVVTAERSPQQIADEAGFKTQPEDAFSFKRTDDSFEGTPGTQLLIKRSKTITFDLYGTASQLNTRAGTVAELLAERGVTVDPGDELNLPVESKITSGMLVSIASVTRKVETIEEVAQFPEEQIKDAQQPTSYKKIQTPGKNGKKLVTYEITVRNGGQPVKTAIKEVITEEPSKQVVIVGARVFNTNVSGEKKSIMAAAGISEADYDYVDYIVGRESGWRVNASNGRTWGLCQALPGSKMSSAGADWETNPVTQMKWCNGYAVGRYGSWAGAYNAWVRQHWW